MYCGVMLHCEKAVRGGFDLPVAGVAEEYLFDLVVSAVFGLAIVLFARRWWVEDVVYGTMGTGLL